MRLSLRALLAAALLGLLGPQRARADDLPFPAGQSIQDLEGLNTVVVRPDEISAEHPASLVVVLHGNGGTATGMAGSLAPWARDGYVVCAPKSTGLGWSPDDLERVVRIAKHLLDALPIDRDRVHVVGFSNGGWNLPRLAFDEDLKPVSATWVAAGFTGGSIPRWAPKRLGVLALVGSEDGNREAAEQMPGLLEGKVRSVEVRVEPGLGHAWPSTLMPYLQWWMGVMEGRFTPGRDLGFDWKDDLEGAVASLADARKGGVFVWVWSEAQGETEEARALQHEVFFDADVRFYGGQLRCVRLEASVAEEQLAAWGVKGTPAVLVLDRHGTVKKKYEGRISARRLASALKSVAPERRPAD